MIYRDIFCSKTKKQTPLKSIACKKVSEVLFLKTWMLENKKTHSLHLYSFPFNTMDSFLYNLLTIMISDKVNPIFSSQIGIYFEWRHFLDVKPDFRIFSISHCFKKYLFLVEQLNLFSSVITPFFSA